METSFFRRKLFIGLTPEIGSQEEEPRGTEKKDFLPFVTSEPIEGG